MNALYTFISILKKVTVKMQITIECLVAYMRELYQLEKLLGVE